MKVTAQKNTVEDYIVSKFHWGSGWNLSEGEFRTIHIVTSEFETWSYRPLNLNFVLHEILAVFVFLYSLLVLSAFQNFQHFL